MSLIKNSEFFTKNHTWFKTNNEMDINSFIGSLPTELNTKSKLELLKTYKKTINKEQYIRFLQHMTHGGDHVSIDYLIKHFKLKINPLTKMLIPTDSVPYNSFKEEALYIWWILKLIKTNTFLCKYYNHIVELTPECQFRIESEVLPTKFNYIFDVAFAPIHVLFECNEYSHETATKIAEDDVKNNTATLCGYQVITLKIKNIFDMSEIDYKKLSTAQIHEKLYNSTHLIKFHAMFIYNITSALLQVDSIRNDYSKFLLVKKLKIENSEISQLINYNINKKNTMQKLITNLSTVEIITEYKKISNKIESDKSQYTTRKSILTNITTLNDYVGLFQIKYRDENSNTPTITYQEIFKFLDIKTDSVSIIDFNKFIHCYILSVSNINKHITDVLFTWEQFSEIITDYDNNSETNIMLQKLYREAGRSFNIITKMRKSHTDALQGDKDKLLSYIQHSDEKSLIEIDNLKLTIAIVRHEKSQLIKKHAITVDRMKLSVLQANAYKAVLPFKIEVLEPTPHVDFIVEIQNDSVDAIVAQYEKDLDALATLAINSDIESDSEIGSDSDGSNNSDSDSEIGGSKFDPPSDS